MSYKIIIAWAFLNFVFTNLVLADENRYQAEIDKYLSERKLETIEGIWKKVYANQGPVGCVTIFYKSEKNVFEQMHIDECYKMDEITGIQTKSSNNAYTGQNAIYYYDGKIDWAPSFVEISEDLNNFVITHKSATNVFSERWERFWPKDISLHNKAINLNK
tara:strand:- start:1980 stop:2462 length:483 start_codon:yes stop_codon:yes gene_type:complete